MTRPFRVAAPRPPGAMPGGLPRVRPDSIA